MCGGLQILSPSCKRIHSRRALFRLVGVLARNDERRDALENVATNVAGASVYFDGILAPIIFASSNQVNAMAPYEIAGRPATVVQAGYNGLLSASVSIGVSRYRLALSRLRRLERERGSCSDPHVWL
jgi:uncharacterized protein (TIGR03437 family)